MSTSATELFGKHWRRLEDKYPTLEMDEKPLLASSASLQCLDHRRVAPKFSRVREGWRRQKTGGKTTKRGDVRVGGGVGKTPRAGRPDAGRDMPRRLVPG
ncbi:hypothetical protein RRG08_006826 [Elysia crispata]|uniref:Uncharacterized protein n=1 Tax=Elysia crispata TaxID=231223 RepID=A0AAE0XVL2_9GAST|nr:hypothetical protein RRG08_006826 [Elysia crispata]